MLLGIPGDATYANYQEANRAFYRLTVLPLATRVTAAVAHWLSGYAGRGGGDRGPTSTRCRRWRPSATRNGRGSVRRTFLTDAEKRALLGLPKRAEGE